jgi:hypothetical protein
VDGELIVGGKEVQMKLFKLLKPIWDLDKQKKLVVISPMLRYVTGSCCDDPEHIPNRKEQNYESILKSGLKGVKNAMKAYLHSGGHHNCRVLDAARDIEGLAKEAIWQEDHKTPRPEVFDRVVKALEMAEVRINEERKRPATATGEGGKEGEASRTDRTRGHTEAASAKSEWIQRNRRVG